jgi:predicted ArsR family transcriptional regulator
MKTSRQQILDIIQVQRVATVGELSQVLHMTQANVRRHLAILQEQGRVVVAGRLPAQGKGRPAQIFAPSEQTLGDNLDLLSSAMLAEFCPASDENAPADRLKHIARRLAAEMRADVQPDHQDLSDQKETSVGIGETRPTKSTSLTKRLYQAIQSLNQRHYQARWEARASGPHLLLGHCPYTTILERHPELCQMDAVLLEDLVGEKVEHIARLARNSRGMTFCIFRVREK